MGAEYDPELDELKGARLESLYAPGGPTMEMRLRTDEGREILVMVVASVFLGKGYEPETQLNVAVSKGPRP